VLEAEEEGGWDAGADRDDRRGFDVERVEEAE